jgi:hypothetical protein
MRGAPSVTVVYSTSNPSQQADQSQINTIESSVDPVKYKDIDVLPSYGSVLRINELSNNADGINKEKVPKYEK